MKKSEAAFVADVGAGAGAVEVLRRDAAADPDVLGRRGPCDGSIAVRVRAQRLGMPVANRRRKVGKERVRLQDAKVDKVVVDIHFRAHRTGLHLRRTMAALSDPWEVVCRIRNLVTIGMICGIAFQTTWSPRRTGRRRDVCWFR